MVEATLRSNTFTLNRKQLIDRQICCFRPGSEGDAKTFYPHFESVTPARVSEASGFDVFTSFILRHLTEKHPVLGVKQKSPPAYQ